MQGIIAPKIEISTKTIIEEVKTIYYANIDQSCVFNPKTIDSKVKYIYIYISIIISFIFII